MRYPAKSGIIYFFCLKVENFNHLGLSHSSNSNSMRFIRNEWTLHKNPNLRIFFRMFDAIKNLLHINCRFWRYKYYKNTVLMSKIKPKSSNSGWLCVFGVHMIRSESIILVTRAQWVASSSFSWNPNRLAKVIEKIKNSNRGRNFHYNCS